MSRALRFLPFFVGVLMFMVPLDSFADKDHHHKPHHSRHDRDYKERDRDIVIRIDVRDRDVLQSYLRKKAHHHCPPGLAKKHNGCLPPGYVRKYYVGNVLPGTVIYHPLPHDILILLQPEPEGYHYVQVDQDILLVSEASRKIIDAVTLFSAVGH